METGISLMELLDCNFLVISMKLVELRELNYVVVTMLTHQLVSIAVVLQLMLSMSQRDSLCGTVYCQWRNALQ